MSGILVGIVDHDRGAVAEASFQMLTAARRLGDDIGASVEAVLIGEAADGRAVDLAAYGVDKVHLIHHDILTDYAPEAWGESVTQLMAQLTPVAVIASGTERGNEILAHVAARSDLAFSANCTEVEPGEEWNVVRVRWGGSLLEDASLAGDVKLLTIAEHSVLAEEASEPGAASTSVFEPALDSALARTRVVTRAEAAAGISLTTAPVVVSGGRGIGSPEGFGMLEELAALLGGAVGCSRVATNNGWRPHSDQVGQTGTRIAPELYIACGISGAIQHWVGCMASKKILAINNDPEAPMVTKADYAVIGDLHEILPAITSLVRAQEA